MTRADDLDHGLYSDQRRDEPVALLILLDDDLDVPDEEEENES